MVRWVWDEISGHLDSGTLGLGRDNGSSGQWYVGFGTRYRVIWTVVCMGWDEITGHLDSGTLGLGRDNGSSGQWYVGAGTR